ncbi:hypothetical protein TrST_g8095 [Triparma strigata]|uniref:RING-type domain-containing protein n=1 Tax=Triparma strigata TaxID=1606541 RepID=A0A9W7C9H1_9STRA|nr:hypothetical protein TrST_g8095 [Triparma strigata]
MSSPGKSANANHLLNFNTSRPRDTSNPIPRRSKVVQRRVLSFLANSSSIKHLHTSSQPSSSSNLPPWSSIRYLTIFQPPPTTCPVCLCSVTCPTITKCGHVFCAICIKLHCLITEDAKCPCCYDDKSLAEGVRLVETLEVPKVEVGKPVAVSLTCSLGDCERVALCDSSKYALQVKKAMEDLTMYEPCGEREVTIRESLLHEYKEEMEGSLAEAALFSSASSPSPPPTPPPPPQSETENRKMYYQSPTTAPVFLSPFTFKQLSYDNRELPKTVSGQVMHIETVVLKPGHQYGFLKHLPEWAEVQLVEVNVGRYVSEDCKKFFKKEINKRKAKRRAKIKNEPSRKETPMGSSFIDRNDPFFWSSSPVLGGSEGDGKLNAEEFEPLGGGQAIPVPERDEKWAASQFSFAKVTNEMGAFPTLGMASGIDREASSGGGNPNGTGAIGGSAWGKPMKQPPSADVTTSPQSRGKGKKKKTKFRPLVL